MMRSRPLHHHDRCRGCNGTGRDLKKRRRVCSTCHGKMWRSEEFVGILLDECLPLARNEQPSALQ